MTIQDAIRTGKPLRRESWANPKFKMFSEWNDIEDADLLADDWEIEDDNPLDNELVILDGLDCSEELTIYNPEEYGYLIFTIRHPLGKERDYHDLHVLEKDIDKLLTFLYNNTDIGKKRVIPF